MGEEPKVPAGQLAAGSRVGRYQILESVGRGGMGEVYAAYHPDLDRRIALKLVHESGPLAEERQARLLREARAIARLSHPNVIAVHDAGTVDDRVYVAMEFVDGLTIDRWLEASKRGWREILDAFVAAGRGLSAAHAAGLVHRDFKPQNVMIAKDGSVRVMDFGLARLAAPEESPPAPASPPSPAPDAMHTATTVTRAGTIVGTPAYMAPEQLQGEPAGAASDQFSFCVALFEALYGIRPFRGEHFLSLAINVTDGELQPVPAPRTPDVPVWVHRTITRGLRTKAADRFPSMDALLDALLDDPAVRRRRFSKVAAVVAVVAVSLLVALQASSRRRSAGEGEIARALDEARRAAGDARTTAAEARARRTDAFAAFDRADLQGGELLWRQIRTLVPRADAGFDGAERSLETALTLDRSSPSTRSELADLRFEHLLFVEDFRFGNKAALLEERLAAVDTDGRKRAALAAPGTLELRTTPAASTVLVERYDRDLATGRRVAKSVGPFDLARSAISLPPGSYRLVIDGPGLAHVVYPFLIGRRDRTVVELSLPPASALPKGFVYIPPGPFLFGDADEQFRTQFLNAPPLHQRTTAGYLIARHETTFGDWISFLEALPPRESARHAPVMRGALHGSVALRRHGDGWQLELQPTSRRYEAGLQQPITYEGRSRRARQEWTRFPVGGIALDDIERYLAWLRDSGRVPGARLCSELEWERAARGADGRLFPHGDELAADDANIDITYDRAEDGYGPDEVGSHPDSRSPFEVEDMAGNVFERVASEVRDSLVIRGGGYFFSAASARSTNREPFPRLAREVAVGLRVCADLARP